MSQIKRILCVDDNVDNNDLLAFMLNKPDRSVTATTTASEALTLIAEEPFDLYVLDVQLPDVDGLELCRTVRSKSKDVPIIIYSAGAYEVEKAAGFDAGATTYLVKPEGIKTIAGIVSAYLSQDRRATARASHF